MEYIDYTMNLVSQLFTLGKEYYLLIMIASLLLAMLESFLPVLPLMAIVTINAAALGMFNGLLMSWIGSGIGTILVFIIANKFSNTKLVNKFKTNKVKSIMEKVRARGFKVLFVSYACPAIPGSLITLTSAFCGKKLSEFIVPMLSGKLVMFFVLSYIGEDFKGFITSPIKIVILLVLVFVAFKLGNKINKELHENSKNTDEEKCQSNANNCLQ